jgi:hypothetical protein
MKVEAKLMGNGVDRLTIVIVGAGLWEVEYGEYKKARAQGFEALISTTVEPPDDAEHLLEKGVFVVDGDISATRYCEQFIPYKFEKVRPKLFHEGYPGWMGQWVRSANSEEPSN